MLAVELKQRPPVPQRCVYILICVMDLLDKALGSSAASGEKKGADQGSLPAAAAAAVVAVVGTF